MGRPARQQKDPMTITAGNVSGVDQAGFSPRQETPKSKSLRQLALRQRVMGDGDAARRRTGAFAAGHAPLKLEDEMSANSLQTRASRRAAAPERLTSHPAIHIEALDGFGNLRPC